MHPEMLVARDAAIASTRLSERVETAAQRTDHLLALPATHPIRVLANAMLAPEAGRHVNPKTTAWMLKHAAATEGGTYTPETGARRHGSGPDLHLHHTNIIRYCSRPFQSVDAMNEALLAAWKETVGEADTIICGGDIALAGALKRERLARVRAMPGRKLLVRGNHDFGKERAPRSPIRAATQRG